MTDNHRDGREYREMVGAYLLGDLRADEREDFERHLEECPECRAEVESLRGVVERLDDANGYGVIPSPDLEERVVSEALGGSGGGSRIRRYTAPALAAAAVLVVVAIGLVGLFGGGGEPGLGDEEDIAFSAPRDVSANGAVVAHTWGTEVMMEVKGLRAGEVYTVSVERRDGTKVETGTFIGVGPSEMDCDLNAAVLRQNARAIIVTDSAGEAVLRSTLERRPADLYT